MVIFTPATIKSNGQPTGRWHYRHYRGKGFTDVLDVGTGVKSDRTGDCCITGGSIRCTAYLVTCNKDLAQATVWKLRNGCQIGKDLRIQLKMFRSRVPIRQAGWAAIDLLGLAANSSISTISLGRSLRRGGPFCKPLFWTVCGFKRGQRGKPSGVLLRAGSWFACRNLRPQPAFCLLVGGCAPNSIECKTPLGIECAIGRRSLACSSAILSLISFVSHFATSRDQCDR